MNPWLRPSIQQPRWIANTIKTLFKPLTTVVTYGKDYWDTWNQVYSLDNRHDVYKPKGSCETCKNYRKTRNICGNASCFYEPEKKNDN